MEELRAPIPPNTHLVTAEFVRALRGISAEAVQGAMESGMLRWVWNVSARRKITEPRFWLREIIGSIPPNVTLPEVIRLILGQQRHAWRGTEVAQMLLVSRPCIHRLRKTRALPGKIEGNTLWIRRPDLERFLNIRWLGQPIFQPN